ncbi:MAG: insulinase family protein [Treponema sp.]|nr:insulinase family protein [Treponema sp.]
MKIMQFRLISQIKLFILLVLFVLSSATVSADNYTDNSADSEKVPLTRKALTGFLPNGLKYFILENSFPENRAHLALVVNAGSVLESDDERGFAHFVEHLAFNDTARFPKLSLIEYFRSQGMRFGADANAYTSYNETVYHFDIPVEIVDGVKRIPDKALAVLDDWTYAVSFLPEDVKSEALVVLEELRTRLGAMDRARKIIFPVLFKGSAYADRDVIGLAEIIENATADQLRAFYDRWYTSDNMALVLVGDFDGKALEADITRHFNMQSAKQKINRPRHELPPPVSGNFDIEIITDPELTAASFNIYYKLMPGAQRGTIASYRESVINYLIDIMLSMRFSEAELDPQSSANGSWGGVWRWSENSCFYSIGTQPKTGSIEQALTELLLEKESMRRFGFTQSEIERAKLHLISYLDMLLSEKDRTESRNFIRGFTNHFILNEDMADIEWEVEEVNSLLPKIGAEEIADAAASYFAYNDIKVFLLAPQSEAENIPSAERIKAVFAGTEKMHITQREDETLSEELLDYIPNAGIITSEQIDTDTGARIINLSNGAKIILKETANRNNEIIMYAMAKGGISNADEENVVSVNLLSEMLGVSGFGPYSRTELVNKLTGKQVSVSFWNSGYYRGFQGSSTTQDLKTLFEMIHLFFTNPRLDERAIAAMIDQYRTYLSHQNEDPQRWFSRELTKVINGNHPLFMPLELEDMEKVSIKQARAFLNQCLNPGDYTFVFTGNINLDLLRELASIYIGSIPENVSMDSFRDPKIIRPAEGRKTIYKGIDERCFVYLAWFSKTSYDFDEQKNQTAAVLSEYLDIILTDEIRERLGGVYSISPGASVSVIPAGESRLNVFFVCNPDRADELINAVLESIKNIFEKPLNTDTFNKSKEALLMSHDRSIQQNLHMAQSYSNSSVLYNTPLDRLNQRPNTIRAVTEDDVQSLCKEITRNGAMQVVQFPEK